MKTRYKEYIVQLILSYYPINKQLLILRANKYYQHLFDFTIDTYKENCPFTSIISDIANMALYYNYIGLAYPSLQSHFINYLKDLSRTKKITIDNRHPYTPVILNTIHSNIIVSINDSETNFEVIKQSDVKEIILNVNDVKKVVHNCIPSKIEIIHFGKIISKIPIEELIECFREFTNIKKVIFLPNSDNDIFIENFVRLVENSKVECLNARIGKYTEEERKMIQRYLSKLDTLKELKLYYTGYFENKYDIIDYLPKSSINSLTAITTTPTINDEHLFYFNKYPNIEEITVFCDDFTQYFIFNNIKTLKKLSFTNCPNVFIDLAEAAKIIQENPLLEEVHFDRVSTNGDNTTAVEETINALNSLKNLKKFTCIDVKFYQGSRNYLLEQFNSKTITVLKGSGDIREVHYSFFLKKCPLVESFLFKSENNNISYYKETEEKINDINSISNKQKYKKLKFTDMVLKEIDFKYFIFKCSNLQCLSIKNTFIPFDCLITLFKIISIYKHIKEFVIKNVFEYKHPPISDDIFDVFIKELSQCDMLHKLVIILSSFDYSHSFTPSFRTINRPKGFGTFPLLTRIKSEPDYIYNYFNTLK